MAAVEPFLGPRPGIDTVVPYHLPAECEWPEAQPITEAVPSEAYPVDLLPESIRAAVVEVVNFVQCPAAQAASSAIAVLSLAAQGLVDVQRASRLTGPVSLYLMSIAMSGDRKTTSDEAFVKPVRQWEEAKEIETQPEQAKARADFAAWTAQHEALVSNIRTAKRVNKPVQNLIEELRAHEEDKPKNQFFPRALYADSTPEALAYELTKRYPIGGVLSSEAGIVFGGHAMSADSMMRNLALLNQLWDGAPVKIDRRTSESFVLRDARLTLGLAVQPETVKDFFEHSRGLARGSGFAARFLISWPESTQGTRFFREAPADAPALRRFHERIIALLNSVSIADGKLQLKTLSLLPEAKRLWVHFHDSVERELGPGGEMTNARDVASKSADNAARLAALFHVFEHGVAEQIGAASMRSAVAIVAWHALESKRFLAEVAVPKVISNASKLDAWLIEQASVAKVASVATRDVQRFGPNCVRNRGDMEQALDELVTLSRIRLTKDGKKRLIEINPEILGDSCVLA